METERWRYVTIKECRAALRKPVPSELDPRTKLKRGYITSIDILKEEMVSSIGELVDLDNDDKQAMEKMIKNASKFWLELEMQRCRIFVEMQGSKLKSAEERVQRAYEGTLQLVIVPALKRFGDSKGLDLNVKETVGKCNGQIESIAVGR
jgi:hypothetical protein